MKSLYHYRAFEGMDADLATSLFEYGLIWKVVKKDYKFIYAIGYDDRCNANLFDYAFMPIDTTAKDEFDWADWDDVYSYTGLTADEFHAQDLPRIISDLISYYGHENVFGSVSGWNIEIKDPNND